MHEYNYNKIMISDHEYFTDPYNLGAVKFVIVAVKLRDGLVS